jgi:hypothetical protein
VGDGELRVAAGTGPFYIGTGDGSAMAFPRAEPGGDAPSQSLEKIASRRPPPIPSLLRDGSQNTLHHQAPRGRHLVRPSALWVSARLDDPQGRRAPKPASTTSLQPGSPLSLEIIKQNNSTRKAIKPPVRSRNTNFFDRGTLGHAGVPSLQIPKPGWPKRSTEPQLHNRRNSAASYAWVLN